MKIYIFLAFCWMFLFGNVLFGQQSSDSTQRKIDRNEIKRRAAEESRKFKASLSPTERKYSEVIELVRKMKAEMVGSSQNNNNLSEKYS